MTGIEYRFPDVHVEQAVVTAGEATSYSSGGEEPEPAAEDAADAGSLASDEALQALREKLTGGS